MSRKTEYKEVTFKRCANVIKSVQCNGCGKTEKKLPDSWHEFSGHHSDWGNDSIESYEYYHACSGECYIKALSEAVKEFANSERTGKIDGFSLAFARKVSMVSAK